METRGGGCTLEKVVGSIVRASMYGSRSELGGRRKSTTTSWCVHYERERKEKRPMIGPVRMEPKAIEQAGWTRTD